MSSWKEWMAAKEDGDYERAEEARHGYESECREEYLRDQDYIYGEEDTEDDVEEEDENDD